MRAIGTPVDARLRAAFVAAAAMAGVAGALQAQVAEFVALNALSVEFSSEILIMLILGAPGGATARFSARRSMSSCRTISRERTRQLVLWIGLLLLAIVFLAPGGLTAWVSMLAHRVKEAPMMLEVRGLSKQFRSLEVISRRQLSPGRGARCALIGPNGAGKTTLINLISGRLTPSAGEIRIAGRNVTGVDEAARVKAGIGRTFQITSLFRRLTVEENVALAVAEHCDTAGRLWPNRRVRERADARVSEILDAEA